MRLYFTACPFLGTNIVFSTYCISTEQSTPAQAVSLLRGVLLLVPMAFLASRLGGMTGVWCAYPLTECLVAVGVMLWCVARSRR